VSTDGTGSAPPSPPPTQPRRDLGFALPAPAKLSPIRAIVSFAALILVLGGAFLAAYLPKKRAERELAENARADMQAAARVSVVTPKEMTSNHAILLPGTVTPLQSTTIYSRANGYLRTWRVDIGDKVKEGQLLAEIDTPELDQQVAQARAQLVQAQANVVQATANRDFSRTSLERYKVLTPQGVTSQQDLDQHGAQAQVDEASVSVAQANVRAMQANIDRVYQLKAFSRVTAPFSGTIVSRFVDIGTLVTAGNATPLFNLVATDPVRVFIQVPQDVAPSVRPDVPADVTVREYAGRRFQGRVTRSAGALDPASRTMNTEVRVPNADGALLAGMYGEVSLTLPNPHKVYELPATALFNDAKGLRLAVVSEDSKVKFVPVVVERDTGATVQISSGLSGGERVVKLANAGLSEGGTVGVVP
jgi:membrane fusion protein, multidrug efflux system